MSGETLHMYQNDEGDTVQMSFHPGNFHRKALSEIAINVSSDPSITGIRIDTQRGPLVLTAKQLENARSSPDELIREAQVLYSSMQEAKRVTLISNPQHIPPPPLRFTNLAPEEASKIIGAATANSRMEISCILYEAANGRPIGYVTRHPYIDAQDDLQDRLRQLYEYMQGIRGDENVIAKTIVRKR